MVKNKKDIALKMSDEIISLEAGKSVVYAIEAGKLKVYFNRVKNNYSIMLDGSEVEECQTSEDALESALAFL